MRVVLDANQFVSAVLVPVGRPAQILQVWRAGDFELALSPPILVEVRRVLLYPRLQRKHGWTEEQIDDFMANLRIAAILTPGTLSVQVVSDDPTDDKYVACALEAEAQYIISGDVHLTRLKNYKGIEFVTPAFFIDHVLATLKREDSD
ncbi:putative toxin-antitoxin system toxin component, PIN family [Chloroflexota bacterium]